MSIIDQNRYRKTYSFFRPKPRFEAFPDQDNTLLKDPVIVATTGPITLSGLQTIDGVSVTVGTSVLVKNQTDGKDNGIYVVDTGNWPRRGDFDHSLEAISGMLVPVISGTMNQRSIWMLGNTASSINLGAGSLDFVQFMLSSSVGTFDNFASYVVMGTTSSLANERVLTAGGGLSLTDAGAGSTVTLSVNKLFDHAASYVVLGATSSLDNERVLSVGTGLTLTDAGAGNAVTIDVNQKFDNNASYVVLGITSSLANERVLSASNGLLMSDAGAGNNVSLMINDTLVLTSTSSATFISTITASIIQADSSVNGVTGAPFTVRAQGTSGTNSIGGNLILSGGYGILSGGNVELHGGHVGNAAAAQVGKIMLSGSLTEITGALSVNPGTNGSTTNIIEIKEGTLRLMSLGKYPAGGFAGTIWCGNVTPNSTNFNVLSDGSSTYFNSPLGGTTYVSVGGAGATGLEVTTSYLKLYQPTLKFTATATGSITQDSTSTNNVVAAPLTIQSQTATGTTSTGGKLILSGGTGTAIGGNVEVVAGAATTTTGSIIMKVGALPALTVNSTAVVLGSDVVLSSTGSFNVDGNSKTITIGNTAVITLADVASNATIAADNNVSLTAGSSVIIGAGGSTVRADATNNTFLSASNIYVSSSNASSFLSNQFTWRGVHVGDSTVTETFRFGVTHVDAAGSDITISAAQHVYPTMIFTGTLTTNISASFPNVANLSGSYFKYLQSDCSGAFDINVKTVSGRDSATLPRQGGGLFMFTPKGVKRLNTF